MEDAFNTWNYILETRDFKKLSALLDENVVFHTPVYLKPRIGRKLVTVILAAAITNFKNFKYNRKWFSTDKLNWALEFEAVIDGKMAKVMMRPVKQVMRFGEMQEVAIKELLVSYGIDFEVAMKQVKTESKL
ncbi:hypothetical protein HK099_007728 [Clydaea vesicula]|uniref:Nuclear transport factor 2 family protein n=1 Tax=Clydaea vesicula TaxID=447962 RepID=A0AAD5XTJ3_9FUNG|nr:hypothetical protein HK099_007728 [Clydaea vesicula]